MSKKSKQVKVEFPAKEITDFIDEVELQRAAEHFREQEVNDLLERLDRINHRLDESTRQLKTILKWFQDFEEFVNWMFVNGFWDAEDIDDKEVMKTYYNGLTRFCRKHNIKLKSERL